MCSYRVNKHLIDLIYTVFPSIEFQPQNINLMLRYVNPAKSTTQQVRVFKSNQMFRTNDSKTNRLQKMIEYKTNEQSKKYLNLNMQTG